MRWWGILGCRSREEQCCEAKMCLLTEPLCYLKYPAYVDMKNICVCVCVCVCMHACFSLAFCVCVCVCVLNIALPDDDCIR